VNECAKDHETKGGCRLERYEWRAKGGLNAIKVWYSTRLDEIASEPTTTDCRSNSAASGLSDTPTYC